MFEDLGLVATELSCIPGDRDFTGATFSTVLTTGASRPLVAEIDGRPVGARAASRHGPTGWIGHWSLPPSTAGGASGAA